MKKNPITQYEPTGSGGPLSCIGIGSRGDVFVACYKVSVWKSTNGTVVSREVHKDQLTLIRTTLGAALAIVDENKTIQP